MITWIFIDVTFLQQQKIKINKIEINDLFWNDHFWNIERTLEKHFRMFIRDRV